MQRQKAEVVKGKGTGPGTSQSLLLWYDTGSYPQCGGIAR